jgi:hypothetical protein
MPHPCLLATVDHTSARIAIPPICSEHIDRGIRQHSHCDAATPGAKPVAPIRLATRYVAGFPMSDDSRELTDLERRLVRWMLEHGNPEATAFLPQLELAEVTSWRCPCGCASINFRIRGKPDPPLGVHPIADFVFGEEDKLSGIFVFEKDGILSGLEAYGLAGDAPKSLPEPEQLRPLRDAGPAPERRGQ